MKILALLLLAIGLAQPSQAKELKPLAPRAPLSQLALTDLNGQPHRLSDYRGKVVLVNFWATWCPPCRAEMPSMQRLKEHLAGKPFAILAVDMAESAADVRDFFKELKPTKIDFTVLLDTSGAALKDWNVLVFPTSYVIDAEGQLRYALLGGAEWDEYETAHKIEELLPTSSTPVSAPADAPAAASGR